MLRHPAQRYLRARLAVVLADAGDELARDQLPLAVAEGRVGLQRDVLGLAVADEPDRVGAHADVVLHLVDGGHDGGLFEEALEGRWAVVGDANRLGLRHRGCKCSVT